MTRRVPMLHKAAPEAYVEINPDDANRLGIVNGGKVKVASRRGSVVMKASINGRGRPPQGMVFVPFFDESYLDQRGDSGCVLSHIQTAGL